MIVNSPLEVGLCRTADFRLGCCAAQVVPLFASCSAYALQLCSALVFFQLIRQFQHKNAHLPDPKVCLATSLPYL